ncbi:MAG: DMT family transporter [Pseudomonadota bacterium]
MPRPAIPSPILIALFGVLMGSMLDAGVKWLAASASVLTIMSWRFMFGAVYTGAAYYFAKRPTPTWEAIRFHTMRALIQVSAALLFFWGITQLALAEATTLGFTASLMIAPFAQIILGEKMTRLSVIAAIVGFGGAAIALSSGADGAPAEGNRLLGAAATLVSAVLYALFMVLLRLRTRTEDSLTILAYSNVLAGIIIFPIGLAFTPFPSLVEIGFYALLAVVGVSVWWLFTIAYARAPAQQLAPLEYTALIWSAGLGYVFFQEAPRWPLYVGAAVIIAACLIVAAESSFATRRATKLPTSEILD